MLLEARRKRRDRLACEFGRPLLVWIQYRKQGLREPGKVPLGNGRLVSVASRWRESMLSLFVQSV
jgi:hypothetical protein